MPDAGSSSSAVSGTADSLAAALVADVISASGGAPDSPQGAVLQYRFFDLKSALLAARRLQWALEGLTEGSRSGTSAALSICSIADPVCGSAAQTLERVMPGQVLLSAGISEPLEQLPGVALRPTPHGSWRELQWPRQADPASFEADEQSVLGLIRALGRQDPCPPAPDAPTPAPATPSAEVYEVPALSARSFAEPEAATAPLWKKPWFLVSAGAAVLVLLAVMIIPAMVPGNHSKAPVPDAATKTVPPAASPGTTPSNVIAPATPEKPSEQKPAVKSGKQLKAAVSPGPVIEPQPKATAASCDLTAGEIPRSLSRAQSLMYAGSLEEAQDAYQRLAGCPSAREKALEGLRLVKQRMATQSP
jgi:hypothetical protein